MDWAKTIKLLRAKLLITQVELASLVGVSFASINRYENGIHEPTMKVKRKLMKIFIENKILKRED
ncbi:MAG: helix-turn-helix transcriptional regulator [Clostridia bacterium]|nr:helix-turn-helix transcriptional regulator [Clostridia bacterium]